MKIFFVLSVLALEAARVRGASANLGRIIGGEDAVVGEAPYMTLFVKNDDFIFCAGSIIHKNWVLTSAECIRDDPFDVIAGAHTVRPKLNLWGNQVRKIVNMSHTITHDSLHNGELDKWDIALIYIEEPFRFSDRVSTIKLPEHEYNTYPTREAVIFGWGYIRGGVLPLELQVLTTLIMSFNGCRALLNYDVPLKSYHVCTEGPEGICLHDGGGPLVIEYDGVRELLGVASWGESPCDSRISPSVFVRVDKALDWINNTMTTFMPI